jgi:hypothetical protein
MSNRYNHKFEDGQIVRDTEYSETFEFSDRIDGYRAEAAPEKLRLAYEDEVQQFLNN